MLKPHFSRQIVAVAGEVTKDALGISDADRQHLESNVSVVIHLAATLSFTESLRQIATDVIDIISQILVVADSCSIGSQLPACGHIQLTVPTSRILKNDTTNVVY